MSACAWLLLGLYQGLLYLAAMLCLRLISGVLRPAPSALRPLARLSVL